MEGNDFRKSLTDSVTALLNMSNGEMDCSRTVKMAFSDMVNAVMSVLKDMDGVWTQYLDANNTDLCGRLHARILAKFKTIDERIAKFENAFSKHLEASPGLSESIAYLKKRVSMSFDLFPKSPRKVDDGFVDLFSPTTCKDDMPSVKEEHDSQFDEEELFTRRMNEFRTAVSTFLNSYPNDARHTGVVGMMECAGNDARHIEEMWRRYLVCSLDIQKEGLYRNIPLYMKSIRMYIDMAGNISSYLNADEKYKSNLDYVEKKMEGFSGAYPAQCRQRPSEFGRKYAGDSSRLEGALKSLSREKL